MKDNSKFVCVWSSIQLTHTHTHTHTHTNIHTMCAGDGPRRVFESEPIKFFLDECH